MTFEFCHRKLQTFHQELKVFGKQLKEIHPDAILCYHNHHIKMVFSLYREVGFSTKCTINREFINLESSFIVTNENKQLIEKLADDLNEFVRRN